MFVSVPYDVLSFFATLLLHCTDLKYTIASGSTCGDGVLFQPYSMAVDVSRDALFVVDNGHYRVQVFNASTGAYRTKFPLDTCTSRDTAAGFNTPWGITVNSAARVFYVSNMGSDYISRCTYNDALTDGGISCSIIGNSATCETSSTIINFVDPAGLRYVPKQNIVVVTYVSSLEYKDLFLCIDQFLWLITFCMS